MNIVEKNNRLREVIFKISEKTGQHKDSKPSYAEV